MESGKGGPSPITAIGRAGTAGTRGAVTDSGDVTFEPEPAFGILLPAPEEGPLMAVATGPLLITVAEGSPLLRAVAEGSPLVPGKERAPETTVVVV